MFIYAFVKYNHILKLDFVRGTNIGSFFYYLPMPHISPNLTPHTIINLNGSHVDRSQNSAPKHSSANMGRKNA